MSISVPSVTRRRCKMRPRSSVTSLVDEMEEGDGETIDSSFMVGDAIDLNDAQIRYT